MNIIEAIQKTNKDAPYITRQAWEEETEHAPMHRHLLLPTNGPDCIIALVHRDWVRSYPRWNPKKDDLLADDWITVGPSMTTGCYDAFIRAGWRL